MGVINGDAATILAMLAVFWSVSVSRPLWLPRIERIARKRQRLYAAKALAKKANAEAWDASYRCYDLCEPPAYIRKADGSRWLGRFQG